MGCGNCKAIRLEEERIIQDRNSLETERQKLSDDQANFEAEKISFAIKNQEQASYLEKRADDQHILMLNFQKEVADFRQVFNEFTEIKHHWENTILDK